MNILKLMRSSKLLYFLLWLVILSFIIWIFSIGGGQILENKLSKDYIVKVGEKTLPPRTLNLALQFQRETIKNFVGEQYVEQFMKDAHKRVVNTFIDSLILEDIAEELGLEVKDSEIAEEIQKAYKFQNPKEQYPLLLQSRGVTAEEFETMLKLDLTRNKLLNFFSQRYLMSDKEAEELYIKDNTKFKVKIILIRNSFFNKEVGEISEEDSQTVYEKEKETFVIPEQRTVKYIMVSSPTIRMSMEIPDDELKNYYEANKSKFGEKPFEQVKMQVKNMLLFSDKKYQDKVKETYENALKEFKITKNEAELQEFAKKFKLEIKTSNPMSLDFPEPPFTIDQKAKEALFKAEKGNWSDVYESQMTALKFCVTDIIPSKAATFEDVKDQIKERLKNEKMSEIARRKAFEFASLYKDIKTIEDEAKKRNYQVQESQEIKLSDPIPLLGKNEDFAKIIFATEINQITLPYQTKDGYALAIPIEKKVADMVKFQEEKSKFIDEKVRNSAAEYIQELTSRRRKELEEKGKISINQDILKRYDTQKES